MYIRKQITLDSACRVYDAVRERGLDEIDVEGMPWFREWPGWSRHRDGRRIMVSPPDKGFAYETLKVQHLKSGRWITDHIYCLWPPSETRAPKGYICKTDAWYTPVHA